MSNGCWTIVTSLVLVGFMPFFTSAANSSYWLPPSQLATFLPFIPAIVVIPELFHVSWVIPERANTCATLTRSVPLSRGREQARQPVDAELRLAAGDDLLGDDVRPAVLQRDVKPGLGVEALLHGRVVAGELRLRHPLELQGDVVQLRLPAARPRPRPTPSASDAAARRPRATRPNVFSSVALLLLPVEALSGF